MAVSKVIPLEKLLKGSQVALKFLEEKVSEEEKVSTRFYFRAAIKFLKECIEKANSGVPVVAHNYAIPRPLLEMFDIVPVCVEAVSYSYNTSFPDGPEYYDVMESYGHPFHTCTAVKGMMGLNLKEMFTFDYVFTVSGPCDNSIGSFPVFPYLQKRNPPKVKVLDLPYYRDERSLEYYGRELIRFRDDLSKLLGQEPDEEKFRKSVGCDNKGLKLLQEINELKKAKPCPLESMFVPLYLGANIYLSGRPELVEFLENALEYAKQNYKKKIKPLGKEKIRTIWPNLTILFDSSYCDYLDSMKGVTILFDCFNYLFYDPINLDQGFDSVIMELARHGLSYPMIRQAQGFNEKLIEDSIYLAREYSADAAIFTNHIGCKSLGASVQLLREALRDELGIPLLSIDVDIGDSRYASLRTIKKKVNMFLKTLF